MNDDLSKYLATRTQFVTIKIPARANLTGIPISEKGGRCIGVRLYLNQKVLNTATNTDTAANLAVVWYGDAQKQQHELLRGIESKFIPCNDLSQVYVRGNGMQNWVQVTIYLNDDQDELLIGV